MRNSSAVGLASSSMFLAFLAAPILTSEAASQTQPSPPRVLAYPGGAGSTPTPLGSGWDSQRVTGTPAVCIVFQQAQSQTGDAVNSQRQMVTDADSYMNALNISADVRVKSIGGLSVDAKTSYAKSVNINSTYLNVVDHVVVDRGVIYTAPVSVGNTQQFSARMQAVPPEQRSAARVQQDANIAPQQVHQNFARYFAVVPAASATPKARATALAQAVSRINLEAKSAAGSSSAVVRLADDMAALKKQNPDEFRRRCGDGYVGSISQGGELAITYTFATTSLSEQQNIAASLGVGYSSPIYSVGGNLSVASAISKISTNTSTNITMYRSGGSGQPVPVSLTDIDGMIAGFPGQVANAPFNYLITVHDYRELPDYDDQTGGMPPTAGFEGLSWEYAKASSVIAVATDALTDYDAQKSGQPPKYLFARWAYAQSDLANAQSTAQTRLAALTQLAQSCIASSSTSATQPCTPSGVYDDMVVRALFPLPVSVLDTVGLSQAVLGSADAYTATLYNQWIGNPNLLRCSSNPGDSKYCRTEDSLASAKAIAQKAPPLAQFQLEINDGSGRCLSLPTSPDPRLGIFTQGATVEGSLLGVASCTSGDPDATTFRYDAGKLQSLGWYRRDSSVYLTGALAYSLAPTPVVWAGPKPYPAVPTINDSWRPAVSADGRSLFLAAAAVQPLPEWTRIQWTDGCINWSYTYYSPLGSSTGALGTVQLGGSCDANSIPLKIRNPALGMW